MFNVNKHIQLRLQLLPTNTQHGTQKNVILCMFVCDLFNAKKEISVRKVSFFQRFSWWRENARIHRRVNPRDRNSVTRGNSESNEASRPKVLLYLLHVCDVSTYLIKFFVSLNIWLYHKYHKQSGQTPQTHNFYFLR